MNSTLSWCVAAVPTLRWADLLSLPGTKKEKIDALWQLLLSFARIDGVSRDEEFASHIQRLAKRTQTLNALQLKALHYTSPNGTDLMITLADDHIWMGGAEKTTNGKIFNANIPTEEVFTAPAALGVNGVIKNTKPLIYQGNTIDGFTLEFKEGKVISYSAHTGASLLKELLETDETSSYLGEVALVDHYSPISLSGKVFYETLLDENASCHLAFGAAYPICVKNGTTMTKEELTAAGLNQSMTHVDFMVGSDDLSIQGITKDGTHIPIMEKGRLLV